MTREEGKQRRRCVTAVCLVIVGVWVAVMLCTAANAAYTEAAQAQELPAVTKFFVFVGVGCTGEAFLRFITWLDSYPPKAGRKAER